MSLTKSAIVVTLKYWTWILTKSGYWRRSFNCTLVIQWNLDTMISDITEQTYPLQWRFIGHKIAKLLNKHVQYYDKFSTMTTWLVTSYAVIPRFHCITAASLSNNVPGLKKPLLTQYVCKSLANFLESGVKNHECGPMQSPSTRMVWRAKAPCTEPCRQIQTIAKNVFSTFHLFY